MTWLGCVALVAVACLLGTRPPARRPPSTEVRADDEPAPAARDARRLTTSLVAGSFSAALVPGVVGGVVAVVAVVVVWVVLGRRTPAEEVRRRRRVAAELPVAVDLLAAALRAGADPVAALGAVVDALPGPAADELGVVASRLALGGDPADAWRSLVDHPQLAPLGRALARAQRAGSSVAVAADRLAADLRDGERLAAETRARAVSTRAAAPLGLCFLPAFVLLGIVPLVAGLVGPIGLS